MRRELMRLAKSKTLFLDETYLRLSTVRHRTLVAPGEQRFVVVEETDAYASRYDMIACCSGEKVFPPMIFTPEDRKMLGVRGITKKLLLSYIRSTLAQAVGNLNLFPLTLVVDRSPVHNVSEILQTFHDAGCRMPKYADSVLHATQ